MGIEYNGRKPFSRPRKLEETSDDVRVQDIPKDPTESVDERQEAIDGIFTDLAKTYLKGKVIQEGLSNMDPAQFIPVEEYADAARAGASRLAQEDSQNGNIITYGLYQKAIEIILDKKWELRGTIIDMKIPASVSQVTQETHEKLTNSDKVTGFLKEFISQNGIVTTIIGMLTISPFQTIIFQALGVENTAKGVQISQIPAGIALFLELGIKAERIYNALKSAKVSTPLVEQQIDTLSSSPQARANALAEIGIDYDQFKKSQEFQDSEAIVKYVSDYYSRYGGLDRPNGHLTIDHWIAYLHVAQNQQLVRGSLNTAPDFSPKFQQYKEQFSEVSQPKQNIFTSEEEKTSKMFIQLASATRALKESSNTMYDDIISSFNYQLTDQDLCCLVQIFGKIGNPDIMFTIASLLRILATNLSGEIIRIENLISRALANLAQDSLFELMSKINKFYYKLVHKITKAFTTDFKNLTACNGMFILGWALIHSVNSIFDQVNAMMKEISALIGGFGTNNPGSWTIAADRRHLLGTARLLEVLAQRLDLANNCDLSQNSAISTNISISDDPAQFNTAILSILEETPPNLTIPEEEKQKHFANIPKYTSENLKFDFGIASEQNSETEGATVRDCNKPASPEQLEALYTNIQNAINETFNG